MPKDLEELRTHLDTIDRRLVDALSERRGLVEQVARLKADSGRAVRDAERERELIARLVEQGRGGGLDPFYVTRIFREIIEHSVRLQEVLHDDAGASAEQGTIVVGYQGGIGAFSYMAATRHFGTRPDDIVYQGFSSFASMLDAVKQERIDYAVLPIENSIAGSINESYDLLARMNLHLVGEEVQRVVHCLIALEEIPLSRIRRVYSHPVALAQCGEFLSTLTNCHAEAYTDTALSVSKIKDEQDLSQAAIASEEAARHYGLPILKRDVADQKENYTRMVIVGKAPVVYERRIPCKTSLIFSTRHERGALARCIVGLTDRGLNLTKLESRPKRNSPWEYIFYVDFEGNVADPEVAAALELLATNASFMKVLGSYPARTTKDAPSAAPDVERPRPGPRRREGDVSIDPAVERQLEKKHYRLVSRTHRPDSTLISVGGVIIGGERPIVIAGPGVVESRTQIRRCAQLAQELRVDVLRGGCFRPTRAGDRFQALGYEGLEFLEEAGRESGLPIIVEVVDPADVERVARQADLLQVGARNMQNYALLAEVGKIDRPVLLKRSRTATIDEWLTAAEYILTHGNQQVILCERGIRTFAEETPATLDLSAIPIVQERSHLPIIVDPTHALGEARWVPPMAEAALAVGAHGVMLEAHPDPARALVDGPQSLSFEQLRESMSRLRGA